MTLSRSKMLMNGNSWSPRGSSTITAFFAPMACISQNAMPTIAFVSESTQW